MQNLIIVANHFPWGKVENFLAQELEAIPPEALDSYSFSLFSIRKRGLKRLTPEFVEIMPDSPWVRPSDIVSIVSNARLLLATLVPKLVPGFSLKGSWLLLLSWLKFSLYFVRLKKICSVKEGAISIYTYWFNEKTYAAVALKRLGIVANVYTRAHGYDFYIERAKGGVFPLREEFIGDIDRIYLLSSQARLYFAEVYGRAIAPRISRLGVRVDRAYFESQQRNLREPTICRVVTCAFYSKSKRVELVHDCLLALAANNRGVRFEWIYIGAKSRKAYLEDLFKEKAAAMGVTNLSLVIYESLAYEDIVEVYKGRYVDAFVLLSESEGLPVSMMEAMSFGIPVISNDVGGIPDLVCDDNGALLKFGAESHFFEIAVKRLIGEDRLTYRNNSYRTICDRYDAAKNFSRFYRELLQL